MTWIYPPALKLRCDTCGTEVHIAGKAVPDGWADLRIFGNDGSPGQVMNVWHFCESCADRVVPAKPYDPEADNGRD